MLRFPPRPNRPLDDGLGVEDVGRRKPRKLAELFRKVNNLFLQIYRFSGSQPWQSHAALGNLKLPLQGGLAQFVPGTLRYSHGPRQTILDFASVILEFLL